MPLRRLITSHAGASPTHDTLFCDPRLAIRRRPRGGLPIACQIRKTIFTMSKSRTATIKAGSRAAGPDGPDDDGWTIPRMISRGGATTARPSLQQPWWSRTGSNRRPEACKATALPTELRPRLGQKAWWARKDLNFRPHAYQACALTN